MMPLAGKYAFILFAAGLFNASLFAASILPLSTAYTVCEGMGFESGLDKSFGEAPFFYWFYSLLIASGAATVLIPNFPLVRITILSQVLNGILLPVVLIFMLKLINKHDLMGEYTNSRWFNVVAWTTSAIVIALTGNPALEYGPPRQARRRRKILVSSRAESIWFRRKKHAHRGPMGFSSSVELSISIDPPCLRIMPWLTHRPSPVPCSPFVVKNGMEESFPSPPQRHATAIIRDRDERTLLVSCALWVHSLAASAAAVTLTRPPSFAAAASAALMMRLVNTCRSSAGKPSMQSPAGTALRHRDPHRLESSLQQKQKSDRPSPAHPRPPVPSIHGTAQASSD